MSETYSIPLTALVKEFRLEVVYASADYESIRLTVEDVARPGLQLTGYFEHFEPMRLQILGNVEFSFIQKKTPQERAAIFDKFFSYKPPALLIARNFPVDKQVLAMAKSTASLCCAPRRPRPPWPPASSHSCARSWLPGSPVTVSWWRSTARGCC